MNEVAISLEQIGIQTDLTTAKVSRIDLFRNITLDHAFIDYRPVLHFLMPSYLKKVREYPTGVWMKNTHRLIRIYDKGAEMKHREQSVLAPDTHVLRAEYSWRNCKTVRKELKD